MEISNSTAVNKYRYKAQQEAMKNNTTTGFERTCDVIDLEQKLDKEHKLEDPLQLSKPLEQFLTCGLTKNQKQRYDEAAKIDNQDKIRLRKLEQAHREYECRKLKDKLETQAEDEKIKNEILKFAHK